MPSNREKWTGRVVTYISEQHKSKLEKVLDMEDIKESECLRELIVEYLKKFNNQGFPLSRNNKSV